MSVRVSFIVPALNEERYVGAALDALQRGMESVSEAAGYEIIVVDDGSADATVEVARKHGVRVIEIRKRNIAAVRNAGAAAAEGRFLVFVDADTRADTELLQEMSQAIDEGVTWGTALAVPCDACPFWARLGLALFNQYYVRWRHCAYGFLFLVAASAFRDEGGFPENVLEGEDMALSKLLVKRHGPPRVFRSRVATSARKASQFGFLYHLKMLWLGVRYGDDMYSRPEIADYRDGDLRLRGPR